MFVNACLLQIPFLSQVNIEQMAEGSWPHLHLHIQYRSSYTHADRSDEYTHTVSPTVNIRQSTSRTLTITLLSNSLLQSLPLFANINTPPANLLSIAKHSRHKLFLVHLTHGIPLD